MEFFDPDRLRERLRAIPDWKRVIFMASCCERMLPNYRSFFLETGYGSVSLLRQALDLVWDWTEKGHLPNNLDTLVSACEQQAPDTSEFASIYTSAALDAVNSIAETLDALRDGDAERAVEVASLSRDSVDLFVQQQESLDPNSPNLENEIAASRLMQYELQRQTQCLEEIEQETGARKFIAARLRARFSNLSYGSLPDSARNFGPSS